MAPGLKIHFFPGIFCVCLETFASIENYFLRHAQLMPHPHMSCSLRGYHFSGRLAFSLPSIMLGVRKVSIPSPSSGKIFHLSFHCGFSFEGVPSSWDRISCDSPNFRADPGVCFLPFCFIIPLQGQSLRFMWFCGCLRVRVFSMLHLLPWFPVFYFFLTSGHFYFLASSVMHFKKDVLKIFCPVFLVVFGGVCQSIFICYFEGNIIRYGVFGMVDSKKFLFLLVYLKSLCHFSFLFL